MTNPADYPKAPNNVFTVNELQLGDVVKLFDGAFGTAMVQKITKDEVTLFRPYASNHNFATLASSREYGDLSGRQIICLTGIETCVYPKSSMAKFEVYHRHIK
jgi:hypothetical protein